MIFADLWVDVAKKKGDLRVNIHLACSQCLRRTYTTAKNKKNDPQRLELNKYCPHCRSYVMHRETK